MTFTDSYKILDLNLYQHVSKNQPFLNSALQNPLRDIAVLCSGWYNPLKLSIAFTIVPVVVGTQEHW